MLDWYQVETLGKIRREQLFQEAEADCLYRQLPGFIVSGSNPMKYP